MQTSNGLLAALAAAVVSAWLVSRGIKRKREAVPAWLVAGEGCAE
jgi:hypothetical protein